MVGHKNETAPIDVVVKLFHTEDQSKSFSLTDHIHFLLSKRSETRKQYGVFFRLDKRAKELLLHSRLKRRTLAEWITLHHSALGRVVTTQVA